jgi:hypothetical protein
MAHGTLRVAKPEPSTVLSGPQGARPSCQTQEGEKQQFLMGYILLSKQYADRKSLSASLTRQPIPAPPRDRCVCEDI